MIGRGIGKEGLRAIAAFAAAAFCLSACQKAAEKQAGESVKAPSAAEVQRSAVADFETPLPGLSKPNPNAAFNGPFTAGGMEPFWSARISGGTLTLDRPESDSVVVNIGALSPKNGVAKVVKGKLTMMLAAQPCSDAGGQTLDYRMLVVYDGDAYEGCARLGEAPASKDWSAFIDDYLPAIDSCLARAKSQGFDAKVTIAYPRTHGHAGVRLSSVTDGRWECDAEINGGAVKFFDPLADSDVMPGEWTPLFTRAPALAPEGACNRNVPATSGKGAPLGWLTYEAC